MCAANLQPTHQQRSWTTRSLLKWMGDHFNQKGVDSPRVVAEMLLAHIIGCERLKLYMDTDRPATPGERAALRELVARAAQHEPVQYLVGHAWFFSRRFEVNRSTLIPRPCTETLVERALHWHRLHPGHASPLIGDVGTGTGCIGICLAAHVHAARVIATDVVPEALELARRNARAAGVEDRMEFRLGPGIDPLREGAAGARFDIICSNPPYIPDSQWTEQVQRTVRDFEPATALRGGPDGLAVISPLIADAPALLRPGGLLAIEIADVQHDAVIELARVNGLLENVAVEKDDEGYWRVLCAERRNEPGQ